MRTAPIPLRRQDKAIPYWHEAIGTNRARKVLNASHSGRSIEELHDYQVVLGGGLEPPCLSAYAPQTYVSAISPPELLEGETINTERMSRKDSFRATTV